MLGPVSSVRTPSLDRVGLVWVQNPLAMVALISVELPPPHEWRRFLDQLRPSSKPLLLWLRGRIWLGSTGRGELAKAIGTSKVVLIVDDDIGRGLATALRWMGSDVQAFELGELERADQALGMSPGTTLELIQQVVR
jgi:hypothetical protein